MTAQTDHPSTKELLNPERLAPSAAILGANTALGAALGAEGVGGTEHDQQTIDLLLRIELAPRDACRAVDLAEQMLVSNGHMSRVVDKVVALGLIERTPDPNDRRANQLVITEAGQEVLAAVAPHIAGTLDRVVHETLSPSEIETLIDLLGRIEREARRPVDQDRDEEEDRA